LAKIIRLNPRGLSAIYRYTISEKLFYDLGLILQAIAMAAFNFKTVPKKF